jgi:peroxiredoxin
MKMKTTMIKNILLGALAVLLPAAAWAGGDEMGDFTLETADGGTFTLGDHLGDEVVVITFFFTTCKPCKKEHPHLQRFYEQFTERGLLVVAVSSDEPGNTSKVQGWINRYKLTFPVLLDKDSAVTRQYNPDMSFPLTLLIGRDKQIHHIYQGYNAGDEVQMEQDLLKLLGEE